MKWQDVGEKRDFWLMMCVTCCDSWIHLLKRFWSLNPQIVLWTQKIYKDQKVAKMLLELQFHWYTAQVDIISIIFISYKLHDACCPTIFMFCIQMVASENTLVQVSVFETGMIECIIFQYPDAIVFSWTTLQASLFLYYGHWYNTWRLQWEYLMHSDH